MSPGRCTATSVYSTSYAIRAQPCCVPAPDQPRDRQLIVRRGIQVFDRRSYRLTLDDMPLAR
jgi:hypothetical protein